jgi:DNA-binding transcriptional ArsR family regulator
MVVLKSLYARTIFFLDPVTAGELVRSTKMSYSSVRRYLEIARNSGLIDSEVHPYKATGKHVYWLTEKGIEWVSGYRELDMR